MRITTLILTLCFLTGTVLGAKLYRPSIKPKKVITIGVIDSGFGVPGMTSDVNLCKYGHKNFTESNSFHGFGTATPVPLDTIGHGTNIVGLIDEEAKKGGSNFCIVVIKYFHDHRKSYFMTDALKYARDIKLDVVNISAGGYGQIAEEHLYVEQMINQGTVIVAAAGNEGRYLGPLTPSSRRYYPASYDDRIIVVGNGNSENDRSVYSNWGPFVKFWENGMDRTALGITLSGTSQSTAVFTGKFVAKMLRRYDN